jgi:hypothetical protein
LTFFLVRKMLWKERTISDARFLQVGVDGVEVDGRVQESICSGRK